MISVADWFIATARRGGSAYFVDTPQFSMTTGKAAASSADGRDAPSGRRDAIAAVSTATRAIQWTERRMLAECIHFPSSQKARDASTPPAAELPGIRGRGCGFTSVGTES